MKLKTALSLAVVCALLLVPGTAIAASPTQDAYSGVAGVQQDSGTPGAQVSPASESAEVGPVSTEEVESAGGTLPFTGLEVGLIAVVGAALLGGGVVLYRLNRREQPHL
jgi:hypothetical protein